MRFGNIADAIADAFSKSGFHDLKFFGRRGTAGDGT